MKIKSKDIDILTGCKNYYMINHAHLLTNNQRNLVFHMAIRVMCHNIAENREPLEICKKIHCFLEERYVKEWFPLEWQLADTLEYDYKVFERFILQFSYYNKQSVDCNKEFFIPFNNTINEMEVHQVVAKADLIILEENKVNAYIIKKNYVKDFSYCARKNENKILCSIELQFLLYGLKEIYKENDITVHMIRLIGKQDTENELKPFNEKKGNNIISLRYDHYVKSRGTEILANIQKDISKQSSKDCNTCIYQQLCKFNLVYKANRDSQNNRTINFTYQQKKVIDDYQGYMRVVAGPGSGKTATLIARIDNMIKQGIRPNKILAITFTKKAAREMKARIKREDMFISTIHSFALNMLQEYCQNNVEVIDKVDQVKILLDLLKKGPIIKNVSYQGLFSPYGLISTLLSQFIQIDKYGKDLFIKNNQKKDWSNILKIKSLYDQILESGNYYTYDGLIKLAVTYLKENLEVAELVKKQFPYILVDEVQDVDSMQAELIQLITKDHLMICGDVDQAIYEFRGASNDFMLRFNQIYPNTKLVQLNDNFRSTKEIVHMATELICHNEERIPISYIAHKSGNRCINYQNGNINLINLINNITEQGYQYGDIAIISRLNSDLKKIEEMLSDVIPVEKPKYYLREDFIFISILNLLTLYYTNMEDDKAFFWFLKNYKCDIQKSNITESIYKNLVNQNVIYDFYGMQSFQYEENQELTGILKLMANIYHCFLLIDQLPVDQLLESISSLLFMKKLDYETVVLQLNDLIAEHRIKSIKELWNYMKSILLYQSDIKVEYNLKYNNLLHLLTAHESKGLEFPVVIIYGIDNFERDMTEEERRVLYVALTRAEEQLYTIEIESGRSNFMREINDTIVIKKEDI